MNQKLKRIRQILAALILVAAITVISSCEKASYIIPTVDPAAEWHFAADIQPIFTASCISCHDGTPYVDLREGNSYEKLTKGKYVTLPGETSKLYAKLLSGAHLTRATEIEKAKILVWINLGARND